MSPKKKTASANTGRLEELLELLKTRILVLDGAMGRASTKDLRPLISGPS